MIAYGSHGISRVDKVLEAICIKLKVGKTRQREWTPTCIKHLMQSRKMKVIKKLLYKIKKKNHASKTDRSLHTSRSIPFSLTRKRLVITYAKLYFSNLLKLYNKFNFINFTILCINFLIRQLN